MAEGANEWGAAPGQIGVIQGAGDVHLVLHLPVRAHLAPEHLQRHVAPLLRNRKCFTLLAATGCAACDPHHIKGYAELWGHE